MSRYARQLAVGGVTPDATRRLADTAVVVRGRGVDARVAALYLAGAGVGRLQVHDELVEVVAAINREVVVVGGAPKGELLVTVEGTTATGARDASPTDRGASVALDVLARRLGLDA